MNNNIQSTSQENEQHWAEEILKLPKRELVYIITSLREDIKEAIIDYSQKGSRRLSDALENYTMNTLGIIDSSGEDLGINLDYVIGIEIKACNGKEIILDPEILSLNKPAEIEIIFSNGIGIRGVIYMKDFTDINKRINSPKFINIVNISGFSNMQNGVRTWKQTPFMVMCVNTKHIGIIRKKRDLFKSIKAWIPDAESSIKGKKKLGDKIVPLDYIEETPTDIFTDRVNKIVP